LLVAGHRDDECAGPADHALPVIDVELGLQRQDRQAIDDRACLHRVIARILGRSATVVRAVP
jgi:hypothetical protein